MHRLVLAILIALVKFCCAQEPFVIKQLISEGDTIPGVATTIAILDLDINNQGEWLGYISGASPNKLFWIHSGEPLYCPVPVPVDYPENQFVNFARDLVIGDSGSIGGSLFTGPDLFDQDQGLYIDEQLIVLKGEAPTAPSLSGDSVFYDFYNSRIVDGDELYGLVLFSPFHTALVKFDLKSGQQSVIVQETDSLRLGLSDDSWSVNDSGDAIYTAEVNFGDESKYSVFVNDKLVAQVGAVSPLRNHDYSFLRTQGRDINNRGDYVLAARVAGKNGEVEVIVVNDFVFKKAGDSAPDGYTFNSFSAVVHIGDNGNVLWQGQWTDANLKENFGLYLNDTLIARSGNTIVNGMEIQNVFPIEMSNNGIWAICSATLEGSGATAISIDLTVAIGDVNSDGDVNLFDVQPFVDLASRGLFRGSADINGDGEVDLLDVAPFVDLLSGG